jgi:hypothetical protein
MLTQSMISKFENYKNGTIDQTEDPRAGSFNGISGYDLFSAWQAGDYTVGTENDKMRYDGKMSDFATPSPSAKSPVAAAFAQQTGLPALDYAYQSPEVTGKQSFAVPVLKEEPVPQVLGLLQEPVQPSAQTERDISDATGVKYNKPELDYTKRANLLNERLSNG